MNHTAIRPHLTVMRCPRRPAKFKSFVLCVLCGLLSALLLAIFLTSCGTAGIGKGDGSSQVTASLVRNGAMLKAHADLKGARTDAAFHARRAKLTALADVLESVQTAGLTPEALRGIVLAEAGNDLTTVAILDIVISFVPAGGTSGVPAVPLVLLQHAAAGIRMAVTLTPDRGAA